jgi:hypothetical protein
MMLGVCIGSTANMARADDAATQLPTITTASEGVVNGALLQDIPLLRPGETLETVPGLVVTQHSGDGKANQYFLRGYNLDHGHDLAVSLDGVPVNMPTNAHGQGYIDLNYLIPELVDHIDYRKGPYFAETGDFSAAGSADIAYRNSLAHSFASLTLGSFDYQRLLLAGSTPINGAGPMVLGALELQHTDGPWTTAEDQRPVAHQRWDHGSRLVVGCRALLRLVECHRSGSTFLDRVWPARSLLGSGPHRRRQHRTRYPLG